MWMVSGILPKSAWPFNSRLDKNKPVASGFRLLPVWQGALGRYLKELEETEWVRLL